MKQYIKENRRTRAITWLVDIAGKTGKSLFADLLEIDPECGCIILQLDYYRAFKYSSALTISNYISKTGQNPKAIVIDAPRDEEIKFLHEIYGVLEEINNGRLFGSFGGRTIKQRMPRGIPIIVFSNSPPVTSALSFDRWDIKALYRTVDNKEVYVQDAKVSCNVHDVANNTVTWQNFIETVPWDEEKYTERSTNIDMLFDMYSKNFLAMKKLKEKKLPGYENIAPGIIKSWAQEQTVPTIRAPSYVQRKAQKLKKLFDNNRKY